MMEVIFIPIAIPAYFYSLAVFIAWRVGSSNPFRDGWWAFREFVGVPVRQDLPKQFKGVYRWTGSGWLVVGLSKNGVKDYLDPARVIWQKLP